MSDFWPLVLVIVFVVASVAHIRLRKSAQPLRLELADKGSSLLEHPNLSESQKQFVKFLLVTAFDFRRALLIATFLVPVIALITIVRPSYIDNEMRELDRMNPEAKSLLIEIARLHDRITFANHPLLLLLIEFEILIFMPIAILTRALIRGVLPTKSDRDTVMNLIEVREVRFAGHRKLASLRRRRS